MAKNSPAAAQTQIQLNPKVSIVYSPEEKILDLGNRAVRALLKLEAVKVTNPKTLKEADDVISGASGIQEEIIEVRDALASRVKEAFEPYKRLPLFAGSEINITLSVPLRQRIDRAYSMTKQSRANYLSAEQERIRRENLAKQAEQDRINAEAAKKAAAEAKKQGADKQTVQDIKMAVMETPAPVVTSKALESATSTVRYQYTAEITSLKSFLGACLNNAVLLNTLAAAIPDIEKAFREMAGDQKEAFNYPGIAFKKTPVDVGVRR